MKKGMKKFIATVSAALACALPVMNSFPAYADTTTDYETYRLYFDVNKNSGVAICSINFTYDYGKVTGYNILSVGNLGDTLHVGGGREFGTAYYINDNGNIYDAGTLFTLTAGTPGYIWDNFNSFSIIVKDQDGVELNQSLVKISTVLVGDANDDGKVDNNDVTAIYSYLTDADLHPLNSPRGADTNRDGVVDFTDAVNIYNYLNGQIEGFYVL